MTDDTPRGHAAELADALLDWYAAHQRDLPWRRTDDPYRIWVSEVMLQQTRVTAVIPYYEHFLTRFATVQALAEAELSEVLALWQGLGYYARARSLHRAARIVVAEHGGQLPADRDALLALPGIGDYTAGALLSIAFGQDAVALDGNVKRILARLFDYDDDIGTTAAQRTLEGHARALLPAGRARAFNQALMDLGTAVCLPGVPACGACPIAAWCLARARGVQEQRPVRTRRGPNPTVQMVAAYAKRDDGRWLIARRRPQGLLGGLWELPSFVVPADANAASASEPPATLLAEALAQELHVGADVGDERLTVAHGYSHFKVRVRVYVCRLSSEPALQEHPTWDALHWLTPDQLADYGLTGVTVKALDQLQGTLL